MKAPAVPGREPGNIIRTQKEKKTDVSAFPYKAPAGNFRRAPGLPALSAAPKCFNQRFPENEQTQLLSSASSLFLPSALGGRHEQASRA